MIDYKKILENNFIKDEYKKIDSINPYPFNHGLKHVNNVCNIMDRLCKILKIDDEEKEALLIACALHDVGQYDGRDNHGLKARKITERLFDNELKDSKYYNDIYSSIEEHDSKCDLKYSLFTILVQFSDKMDFTKERLENDSNERFGHLVYDDINLVTFIYNNEQFGINISTNKIDNIAVKFLNRSFSVKIINAVKVLANKLGLEPIIKIDGEILNLNKYIIIHGSFGSKDGNWFPWLKRELEKKKLKVDVPQFPIGVGNQNYDNWSKVLDNLYIDEDTTIIGHSIAPIFICKYLITHKIKVKKLIFVCGFNNYLGIDYEFDAVNNPMFIDNYKDVKKYCDNIICYYSNNDPYVPFDIEKEFADNVSNEQIIINNGGHINSESGYTEFKEILNEIEV